MNLWEAIKYVMETHKTMIALYSDGKYTIEYDNDSNLLHCSQHYSSLDMKCGASYLPDDLDWQVEK